MALVLGLVGAVVAGAALGIVLTAIGNVTGALVPCSPTPRWWRVTFLPILVLGPIAGAAAAGLAAGRWYARREKSARGLAGNFSSR